MFNFPDIPKVTYKRNFLRSSVFSIEFAENLNWEKYKENIYNVLKNEYPIKSNGLTIDINLSNKVENIVKSDNISSFEFKSIDGLKSVSLNRNTITFMFHGKSYISFSSFKSSFDFFETILKNDLSDFIIKQYTVRKINLIDVSTVTNSGLSSLKRLINNHLIGNIDYAPNIDTIKQSISSITFENNGTDLNIKYGYNKINNIIGQIILDLSMFKIHDNSKSIIQNIEFVNTEIYKAFNWAITDEFKNIMNYE